MSDRRGSALALVLWLVVALSAVASGAALTTRGTSGIVANYRARAVGRYAAESGVELAVATLQGGLARAAAPDRRRDYLNHLDQALGAAAHVALGDARVDVALVDVGARLDLNGADPTAVARLFSFFVAPVEAERAAATVRAFVRDGRGGQTLEPIRPLRSVDELASLPGFPPALAARAAPYLTVDGDGRTNRVTASDTVLAAAAGQLADEPSRILVVSRGWQDGHPLTHEIEAVYAVAANQLTLVRWRERDR